jgi:prephenate dehydrogenase
VTSFTGEVRIVGAGLLGTSIGLALTKQGIDVALSSKSTKSVDLAVSYGAGRAVREDDSPKLIVVCVPPQLTAQIIAEELIAFPDAIVTDVASVKLEILEELERLAAPIERYVGSHPMAGRERGGAIAGRADLFVGRPWVITPNAKSESAGIKLVADLAATLESAVVTVSPKDHDRAVALVSHVPQLVSSLLAARLVNAKNDDVALAGQGLRDTTRIAASDPDLWVQILEANSAEVLSVLQSLSSDLTNVIGALQNVHSENGIAQLRHVLEAGNIGVEKIPGKHGTKHSTYAQIVVMIDDKPGELARLLTEVGEIGINLEELKLEHSPSAQIGLVELHVIPEAEASLIADLQKRGWRIA